MDTEQHVEEEEGDYEKSTHEEKQADLRSSHTPDSVRPIILKTDKAGHLLLETAEDLQNFLLLRQRPRKTPVNKPPSTTAAIQDTVPYYVDEEDFFKACDQSQLPVIDRYLAIGGDVSATDKFHRTGLHRACVQGHVEVVKRLLDAGAQIQCKDKLQSSCVHSACRGGNVCVLELLLTHGGDFSARDKLYSTPLHVAVRTGHYECVEKLIHCGAELNAKDREGDTALHDAARLNRFKIIELLLLHGANGKLRNHEGKSALDIVMDWQNEAKTVLTSYTANDHLNHK